MTPHATFGDRIDWDNEARRAAAETTGEYTAGGVRAVALDLVAKLREFAPVEAPRAKGKPAPKPRLLDCGCNIGRYYPPLVEAGYDYTGVDQSPQALDTCRERYPGVAFYQSMLWDLGQLPHVGEHPGLFDVAISMAVLQHNTHAEKRRILAAIAACVKPGGLFAMQESTVLETTPTQLKHREWIDMVTGFGFELLATWHPNPEYGVNDAYLFRRIG